MCVFASDILSLTKPRVVLASKSFFSPRKSSLVMLMLCIVYKLPPSSTFIWCSILLQHNGCMLIAGCGCQWQQHCFSIEKQVPYCESSQTDPSMLGLHHKFPSCSSWINNTFSVRCHKQAGVKRITCKTEVSGAELLGPKQRPEKGSTKQPDSELATAAHWARHLKSFGWCKKEEGHSANIHRQTNK